MHWTPLLRAPLYVERNWGRLTMPHLGKYTNAVRLSTFQSHSIGATLVHLIFVVKGAPPSDDLGFLVDFEQVSLTFYIWYL